MKIRYITTAALGLSLMTGCVEIKIEKEGGECKIKHSEKGEKEDREEGEEHEGKEHHKGDKAKHEKGEKEEGEKGEENEGKEKGEAKKQSEADLKAEAKISEADARATAMQKVPDGTIKEGELEKENGKLIWSFDIARPGTQNITEVNINAVTGEIVAVDVETPKSEAKEADDEKKEKKDKD